MIVIQPIFPFESAGLFVINEEEDYHYEILDEEILNDDSTKRIWDESGRGPFKYKGSGSELLVDEGPALFNIYELMQNFHHPHLQPMYDEGLRQMIAGPLKVANENIGFICFNGTKEDSFSPDDIPLFQSISDQLAIAVANIITNEEILKEKQQKEVLLEISEVVATIQNENHLSQVIYDRIKTLIPF